MLDNRADPDSIWCRYIMISEDTPLLLHHYELSPYSEKIRAMCGYLDMPWHSVITPAMPPRPMLDHLSGGYRKIPVAQIGADIYCDTRVITPLLAAYSGKPELDLYNCDQAVQDWVAKVEGDLFFACVLSSSSLALNRKVLKTMSLLNLLKLLVDRINMGRKAAVAMPSLSQAPRLVKDYLPILEEKLQQDYLFADTPNIADFSSYHGLWFLRDLGEKAMIKQYPGINAWMDRIKQFGHGHRSECHAQKALEIAKYHSPLPVHPEDKNHDLIGELVQIAPTDYGLETSTGFLEGATTNSYILSREDPETGQVHVHFPKQGFSLSKVN